MCMWLWDLERNSNGSRKPAIVVIVSNNLRLLNVLGDVKQRWYVIPVVNNVQI